MFWSKLLSARRQIRFQFNTPACLNVLNVLNVLAGCRMQRMMAPDTLSYGIARVGADDLPALQHALLYRLIRNKSLAFGRLLSRLYMIAADLTGYASFDRRHCESCLRQQNDGKTVYLHEVLEAKLVTPNGLALSVASEFVENPE